MFYNEMFTLQNKAKVGRIRSRYIVLSISGRLRRVEPLVNIGGDVVGC